MGSKFLEEDSRFAQENFSECCIKQAGEPQAPSECVYLEIDGSQLNTTRGWREYKLALSFRSEDVSVRGTEDSFGERLRTTIHKKNLIGAINIENNIESIKERIKSMMVKSGDYWANQIVLISDGAVWIENVFQSLFPKALMILDWYHALENVRKCAENLFSENSEKYHPWFVKYKEMLWDGRVEELLADLLDEAKSAKNSTPLFKLYNYFKGRKERIRYKEFREKGYFIGSGAIESANSYSIQNRLKRSRMKWKVENANGMAHLRNGYYSDRWDEIWGKIWSKAA